MGISKTLTQLKSRINNARRIFIPSLRKNRRLLFETLESRRLLVADEIGFILYGSPPSENAPYASIPITRVSDDLFDFVTINYVVGGTASAGSNVNAEGIDHDLMSGTVVLQSGQDEWDLVYNVQDDDELDPGETITVTITSIESSTGKSYYRFNFAEYAFEDNDVGDDEIGAREVEDNTTVCSCSCSCSDVAVSYNLNNAALYATSNAAGLKYDSAAAGMRPMLQADLSVGAPVQPGRHLEAVYTYNDVELDDPRSLAVEHMVPGEWYRLSASKPVSLPSGYYAWQAQIRDTNSGEILGGVTGHSKVRNYLDSELARAGLRRPSTRCKFKTMDRKG